MDIIHGASAQPVAPLPAGILASLRADLRAELRCCRDALAALQSHGGVPATPRKRALLTRIAHAEQTLHEIGEAP